MYTQTIRNVSHWSLLVVALVAIAATSAGAFDGPSTSSEKEKELLALLQSDAAPAEKALACKKLAIHGSAGAVPELAKLLPNPQLSSWARIALEAIPGEASSEALRDAAGSLDGRLLVGMINSIGVREDAKAVDLLTKKLQADDAEVASAAAVALGNIGNEAATQSLRAALTSASGKVRSAVAEGCVLCAERLHKAGDTVAAADLYDEIRSADVPKQRILEATRGAILARRDKGIPLLLELFQSDDKAMFQLALGTVREFSGDGIDQFLPDAVTDAQPDRAALIIQAMADRSEFVILSAVLKAAEDGPKQVRLSAIDALRRVGDDSCLRPLLAIATDSDEDLAAAAQETLAVLPGRDVDGEIGVLLPSATGDTHRILLQLAGQRHISELVEEIEKALDHRDSSVRHAALVALGQTVSLKKLSVLVSQVVRPQHAEDAAVAQNALKAASVRMPDREACAAELTVALNRAPAASKTTLLEIISAVGGSTALQTLATAAKSNDDQLQDAGSRLLGKWNSLAAAPVLLDLAKTGPQEKYRVRALRGYIGLARKFAMPHPERATMCRNAFNATGRLPERKLVLEVLKIHPSAAGLKLANDAAKVPALKADATAAAKVIAQKIGRK